MRHVRQSTFRTILQTPNVQEKLEKTGNRASRNFGFHSNGLR